MGPLRSAPPPPTAADTSRALPLTLSGAAADAFACVTAGRRYAAMRQTVGDKGDLAIAATRGSGDAATAAAAAAAPGAAAGSGGGGPVPALRRRDSISTAAVVASLPPEDAANARAAEAGAVCASPPWWTPASEAPPDPYGAVLAMAAQVGLMMGGGGRPGKLSVWPGCI